MSQIVPIPQTNIETPEEKEALDLIDTTPHQYEMSKFVDSKNLPEPPWAKWSIGDSVTKTKGSSWSGKVVGYYSTSLTSKGYAVESPTESGSVQIYPEAALCSVETTQQREERERSEWIESFVHKVKHIGVMNYKEILGEMYDSLKGESK
jgi:dihydrofolate reductase (trimethoprim resistance protein)